MKIALLANGPGEVWGWCRPFIHEARGRGWSVDVHLLPCPYASGRELHALNELHASVFLHKSSWDVFKSFSFGSRCDVVLQLGGDLIFGRYLAWRQKIPLVCYSYGRKKGMNRCAVVLTSRPGLYQAERLEVVGDLVLDSLDAGQPAEWRAPAGKRVAVFPGSRPAIRRKAFGYLQGIRAALERLMPGAELRVLLSPFAEDGETAVWQNAGFSVWTGTTPAGIRGADLALTQPGTNTLELMYCRQPFAVAVPFSFLRQMPLSGLIGMIDTIPVVGTALRESIIRRRIPRYVGKTAWPNRLVETSFVPEFIGEYSPEDMAAEVAKLLASPERLAEQRACLDELASRVRPGAPEKICGILERVTSVHGE